jgi:ATP-binding cassette subfamily B multidrug efflux pump
VFRLFERLIRPFPDTPAPDLPQGFFAFLWACTRGVRGFLFLMTGVAAAVGVFDALLFTMMGSVIDRLAKIEPGRLWDTQGTHLMLLGSVLFGGSLLILLQSLIKRQVLAGNFAMRLSWDFHRSVLAQSLSFFQDEFAGRVATKVMQTALAVRDAWISLADVLVFVVIYFITTAVAVARFDLWVLVPFLGWLAAYSLAVRYFIPRLARVSTEQAEARSLMTGRITDAYSNIATVKLFSHSRREAAYARGAMAEFLSTAGRQSRLMTTFEFANHALSMGLVASTAGVALWLWTRGEIGVGAVAAATAMALRLNGISYWVMWEVAAVFEHIGTVQVGIATLAQQRAVSDRPEAKRLLISRGEICFDNVSFSYVAGCLDSARVIDGLNLQIRPGEKIGLVGRSGAGKSTTVNLLLRLYDIPQGHILIDGQDIAQVTQQSLREQIGMVTQDISLLHRSVRDNLLYGRPEASDAQMMAAAKRAQAHDFIVGLVDAQGRRGYDAHVGERGVRLSGGQRQRIAIARVMLKDAPILLLDEATSALDSEAEAAIHHSLSHLMEGKTVVAIAHRLSTIAMMDRLIVLDKGRVVEEGDHRRLLAKRGLYARLWEHQSGGFLTDQLEEADGASARAV